MKTLLTCCLVVLAAAATSLAQQSLGDAARQARAQKQEGTAVIRLEGEGNAPPANVAPPNGNAKAESKSPAKPSPADIEKQKAAQWNAAINAQRRAVDQLQRNLDAAVAHQHHLALAYRVNPEAQAKTGGNYEDYVRQQRDQVDAMKRALDEAKQKLADLIEQARRNDVHVSD